VQAGIHKMPACFFRQARRFAPGLVVLAFPLAVCGQLSPGATRDVGGPEEQFEVKPPAGIQLQAPAAPSAPLTTQGTLVIDRIRFEGLTAFPPSELEPVVAPWLGRPLAAADLNELINLVTTVLRERGLYAALARYPQQDVIDGTALIEILEGRIGRVDIQQNDSPRLRPRVAAGFLASLQRGSLIGRGELDTPLLLLNDLPGIIVEPTLSPGTAPGTADLSVRIDDQPLVAGFVRMDNHQIRELGEYEFTGHLRLRNPLGIGDLVTAELVRSHTGGRMRGALTYSAPVNYHGTRLGALYSKQRYRLGGAFEPLLATGDFERISVVAIHPFIRQDTQNLSGSFSLNDIEYHDRQDAVGTSSDIRHRFGTARVFGDRLDRFGGGGSTAFYLEYQAGKVSLDTPAVAAADAAALDVAGSFGRTRLHVERNQRVTSRSSVFASGTAQFASKNLDVGREIQLTGPDGVRAYPAGELIVDEGYLFRLELRHLLPAGDEWRARAALFIDGARGRLNKDPLPGVTGNTRDLWGFGLSLLVVRGGLNAQVIFAWRGSGAALTDTGRHPRLWFALTQYF
jgi:hemolysin activation/secretion protein